MLSISASLALSAALVHRRKTELLAAVASGNAFEYAFIEIELK